jgi:spermidine synthase
MSAPPPSPPRLHQNSQTLSLSFDSSLIQSSMRLEAPHELVLDYTRAMMGFLLLNPAPVAILMIGLGGGSMLKYLHRHLPEADITTVEIHQGVIDLREDFHIPPDDARLRIVCADGAHFVAEPPRRYDVILVDGFNDAGMPAALCSRAFYQDCRQALNPDGLLVANVQADTQEEKQIAKRLAKVFDEGLALVESDEGGNLIAMAGPREAMAACGQAFAERWDKLAPEHQATLAASSTRLERALRKLRRALT